MTTKLTYKTKSNKLLGYRGTQGIPGSEPNKGPQGIPIQGQDGVSGDPGPTCSCRLDTDIEDIQATGANSKDYFTYQSSTWKKTTPNQIDITQTDFTNVPILDHAPIYPGTLYRLKGDNRLYVTNSEIIIDDFNDPVLDPAWVQTTFDGGDGTYTFNTTTNPGKLTVFISGFISNNRVDFLGRNDFSVPIGRTIRTELSPIRWRSYGLFFTGGQFPITPSNTDPVLQFVRTPDTIAETSEKITLHFGATTLLSATTPAEDLVAIMVRRNTYDTYDFFYEGVSGTIYNPIPTFTCEDPQPLESVTLRMDLRINGAQVLFDNFKMIYYGG